VSGPRRVLGAALTAAALCGVAGCANASVTCTVRHHYAIVIFQGSAGEDRTRFVGRFRLGLRDRNGPLRWRVVRARIALRAASGANPPLVIKTYRAGPARSCAVRLEDRRRSR